MKLSEEMKGIKEKIKIQSKNYQDIVNKYLNLFLPKVKTLESQLEQKEKQINELDFKYRKALNNNEDQARQNIYQEKLKEQEIKILQKQNKELIEIIKKLREREECDHNWIDSANFTAYKICTKCGKYKGILENE